MKIITVSGASSGTGKTCIASEILNHLKDWSAIKVTVTHAGPCPAGRNCGVCGKLKSEYSIITDSGILNEKGKDTSRLKTAGARKVVWLRARPGGLKTGLKKALALLKDAKGVVIESNSALKYIKPDIAIFIKQEQGIAKKSAKDAIRKADLIFTLKKGLM